MGMTIACSIFVLFVISIMPHIMNQIENNWDDVIPGKSDEELKTMFYETESYKTFVSKYPENGEYFDSYGNGGGRLEVTAMNFESYNTLRLELDYNKRTESIREELTVIIKLMNVIIIFEEHWQRSLLKKLIV